jgi:hypothetical protein
VTESFFCVRAQVRRNRVQLSQLLLAATTATGMMTARRNIIECVLCVCASHTRPQLRQRRGTTERGWHAHVSQTAQLEQSGARARVCCCCTMRLNVISFAQMPASWEVPQLPTTGLATAVVRARARVCAM